MLAPQTECFANIVQDFLVCTTIHKARQLGVFQSAIYVRVTLNKMIRQTKTYENSENPYFNEYFVFEIKCTLMELLRMTILYEVKKQSSCKKNHTLGELLIDMQSVWTQSNRCFFKKWGRLELPLALASTTEKPEGVGLSKGFLQIDLAIVSQASKLNDLLKPLDEDSMALNKWELHQDFDDIEKNLLQNVDEGVRCNIRYTMTFYRAIVWKKADYILQFRFHPFKGKTNLAKNTQEPSWNQEVCFVWCYPSLAQTLVLQLLMHEHLQWKCVAEYEIHFREIAFTDKPALGPTFVHLYDNMNGSNYLGRLLMSIKSECLNAETGHVMTCKQVAPLEETRFWKEEQFLIELLLLQGDFINCNGNNCKIGLKLAERNSDFLEYNLKNYPTALKKGQQPIKIFKYFSQTPPFRSVTVKVVLPDNRLKFASDLCLQEIIDFLKTEMESFKIFQIQYAGHYQSQMKVLRVIILIIIRKLEQMLRDKRLDCTSFKKDITQWDLNRLTYLKEYFHKSLDDLKASRSKLIPPSDNYAELLIDEVVADVTNCRNEFQHLLSISLLQDAWPDLIVVLMTGSKEIGYCRLNAIDFMYPAADQQTSHKSQCWKINSFTFKDIKCPHTCINCGCTVAIMRGCVSIVTETQIGEYLNHINQRWKHPGPLLWSLNNISVYYKCRLFIHQAKIRPGADRSGLCDPYVRVMIGNCAAESAILFGTLSPIWNTVICFERIQLPGECQWYLHNPPLAAIEIYDTDKKTADDYLGCGVLPLSVIKSDWVDWQDAENASAESDEVKQKHVIQKYELLKCLTPPPLKWIPIALNGNIRAEVLCSGEMVELPKLEESKVSAECKASVTVGIPNVIRPNMKNYVLEVVFAGFRNYRKRNFLSSKHRVKLMMADLILTSGLTTSPIKNSLNFLVLYASGVVSLPEQLEYWPAIIATDVAVSGKSKEVTLGATLIANSKRYLQKAYVMPCVSKEDNEYDRDSITTAIQLESETESENDNESENENAESSDVKPLIYQKPTRPFWQKVLQKFKASRKEALQLLPQLALRESTDEDEYNWWTKFYNSGFIEPCGYLSDLKHYLCIYQNELEKQAEFSYLNDWADTFKMVHGVRYKKNILPREEIYASLKLNIKITPCICGATRGGVNGEMLKPLATALNPRYQAQLQALAELVKLTVRVYIVQGIQLRPSVKNIQADAYVKIQLGQQVLANRADYIPQQSNPVFGKCFQLEGLLPREHLLEITLFNRKDVKDEIIGSTFIDLEDRWRSKHRATVGIANEYSSTGYNKWHDPMLPSEILREMCRNNDLRPPKIIGNEIEVDGFVFQDETEIATSEDLHERLCLTVLRNFEHLPSFGFKLVPQHVETRSLFRNDYPGIEQGKLQLWIELYDGNLNIPPPIDITPQQPELYELRVIVFNVAEVILDEKNIFGTAMSDIYVKGWCSNFDEAQSTDIHYRSTNGEGNFNWRMLFPLKYSKIEDMLVTTRRSGILEEFEFKQPPILHLQIWDNDLISSDDFLGSLEINLSAFPEPYDSAKSCELLDVTQSITSYGSTVTRIKRAKTNRKLINLFKERKVRGWFPMRGNLKDKGRRIGLAGKIELELEVMTQAEATINPAGLGRNGPLLLADPNRPKSSFNPLTNPWKGTKTILFPKITKFVVLLVILVILGLALLQLFYQFPLTIIGWRN